MFIHYSTAQLVFCDVGPTSPMYGSNKDGECIVWTFYRDGSYSTLQYGVHIHYENKLTKPMGEYTLDELVDINNGWTKL